MGLHADKKLDRISVQGVPFFYDLFRSDKSHTSHSRQIID